MVEEERHQRILDQQPIIQLWTLFPLFLTHSDSVSFRKQSAFEARISVSQPDYEPCCGVVISITIFQSRPSLQLSSTFAPVPAQRSNNIWGEEKAVVGRTDSARNHWTFRHNLIYPFFPAKSTLASARCEPNQVTRLIGPKKQNRRTFSIPPGLTRFQL